MARSDRSSSPSSSLSTIAIIVLNSIVLLTIQQYFHLSSFTSFLFLSPDELAILDSPTQQQQQQYDTSSSNTIAAISSNSNNNNASPFGWVIPQGIATPRQSIPTTPEEEAAIKRQIYGGKGDKQHLGGFTSFDPSGVSPTLWKHMVEYLGIRSVLDLGCGRGISTSWFILHGLEYVVCAEGSHDAVMQSLLPTITQQQQQQSTTTPNMNKNHTIRHHAKYDLIEHDFSLGPWWPKQTVDVAWCVEFTEHVGRNYMMNYHTAFRKAALIFVTHSNWGGWHHVEVHKDDWWRAKMESSGFIYSDWLTKEMRAKALQDKARTDLVASMTPDKMYHVAQHLWTSLQVFINPLVASLAQHQHLFAEPGCFDRNGMPNIDCELKAGATPLPENYKALNITKEMDDEWFALIKDLPLP